MDLGGDTSGGVQNISLVKAPRRRRKATCSDGWGQIAIDPEAHKAHRGDVA